MDKRKDPRLPQYDYATPGGYFVTICTRDRRFLFGDTPYFVGRDQCVPPNRAWEIAAEWIGYISKKYPNWTVDNWVVMPNHVHLLLQCHADNAAGHIGPALQTVMQWYKTMTTNAYIRAVKAGELPPFQKAIWQASYYDHVVRNDGEYERIW